MTVLYKPVKLHMKPTIKIKQAYTVTKKSIYLYFYGLRDHVMSNIKVAMQDGRTDNDQLTCQINMTDHMDHVLLI